MKVMMRMVAMSYVLGLICGGCQRDMVLTPQPVPQNRTPLAPHEQTWGSGQKLVMWKKSEAYVWTKLQVHAFVADEDLIICYKPQGSDYSRVRCFRFMIPAGVTDVHFILKHAACIGDVATDDWKQYRD